jgi:LysM repeat protein
MNLMKKTTLILVVIAISIGLVLTVSQPASAAVKEPGKCTRWHTVQKGEYLSKIAELYDTNWFSLVEINQLTNPSLIFAGNKLCIFHSDYSSSSPVNIPTNSGSGRVFATSVKEDHSVALTGKNLATNTRYTIYLGNYKSDPAIKISVGSISTDKNGAFQKTVAIPKKLYDVMKIRVSISSPTGSTMTNWFINTTSSGNVGGVGSPEVSIDIRSVKKSQWVKIDVQNLPANVTFKVYMRKPDAPMKKAVLVGTLSDPKGRELSTAFDIPDSLKNLAKLEILLINNALNMEAEATFNN